MAIWQCTLFLVPLKKEINCFDNDFEKSLEKIKSILPEKKSWCKDIKQYGNLDSSCLEICTNGDVIDDISLRIDLRNITPNDLKLICEFAKTNNLLFESNNKLFDSNLQNLISILKSSTANRFLTNSKEYLLNVRHKTGNTD